MFKNLWIKFFLLLVAVSLVALSSAFLLRELMLSDFREYLEGEMEDRVYWVTASLESTYEKYSGWKKESVAEDIVWAYMLGFKAKLYDSEGALVIDTEEAVQTLSPLIKKRVLSLSGSMTADVSGNFIPYTLFLGGKEIGQIEVGFLRPKKEDVFILRSNRMLLLSLLLLGGIVIVLSLVFSRKLTKPVKRLTEGVTAISGGNLKERVSASGKDEISRLSDAFNKMAQTLETQESLRKKLTSNIAHELRTPLTIVRGELEGMMDGIITLNRENLESLYGEIGRLRNIIERIEDLSQAEASSLNLRKQHFELMPFLNNIAGRFQKAFSDKGVSLETDGDKGLVAHADPERLSQILMNLLSNAMRATEKGGLVTITAARKNTECMVAVTDTGCGIKKEDLPFIFERFYKGNDGGLGLGLAIVKELVDAHGGRIEVQSEYGRGASFKVFLPY